MRYLIILFLSTVAFAQTAVDGYVNLNLASPSAPGTAISSTIMTNGSTGILSGCTPSGSTGNMTVGVHNPALTLAKPIIVNGVTYGTGTTSQSFSMNMASANTILTCNISGTGRIAVFSFGWKAPAGNPSNVEDIFATQLSTRGFEMWIQWVPTNSLRIESAKDSFATSPGITLVPGNTYQIVVLDDYVNGVTRLAVFNTSPPFAQVGTTQQMNQFVDAGHDNAFFIGNGEIGTSNSTQQIENFLIDNTSSGATFPTMGVGSTVGAPPWQGIVAPTRAIDWSKAGVVGGIPSAAWTQCGATMGTTSTAAQINVRLASCSANQFVLLSPGTFNLNDAISINNHSNVALRGAGANQTFLVFTNVPTTCGQGVPVMVCVRATDSNFSGGPTNTATWSAGYTQGATAITLSAHANLKVGNYIILDQLDDDATACDNGGVLVADITTTCATAGIGTPTSPGVDGPYSGQGNGGGARTNRAQQQIVQVVSCGANTPGAACTTNNLVITPGLYMSNWATSKTPGAWWATSPSQYVGIENMSLDSTSSGQNASSCSGGVGVSFYNSPNSWVSGIRSIDTVRAHVQLNYSPHVTVRDSYFWGTQDRTSCSYGIEFFSTSDTLVENNIFQAIPSPYMSNGPDAGSVFGYNYSIFNLYTASSLFTANAHGDHDAGNGMALIEGNVGNVINADVIHGTGNLQTYFRDYYSGLSLCWQSSTDNSSTAQVVATATVANCNNNLSPFVVNSFHRFYNLIGNVTGTTGTNTGYQTGTWPNFGLGTGNPGFTPPVPNDPNVTPTTLLFGNAPASNGFTGLFSSADVPSTLSNRFQQFYSTPVPASNTLPASFYLSAKPSFFATSKPFPLIGPDISGGNIAGVGGRANTIPAQDCFLGTMGGPTNGVSQPLSFNASVCFTASSGSPIAQVLPSTSTFPAQQVGTTSSAAVVTINNIGTASMTLSVTTTGDYAQTNNCGSFVAAGSSCTANVTFTPITTGVRSGSLVVTDNATGSPHTVALSGTGVQPNAGFNPTSLTFVAQNVGTSSASSPVVLTNTGSSALVISSIAASGDFSQSNNCPITPASLAVSSTCTINATFSPTATGVRSGTISVVDNAAGSPQTVPLSGTGNPGGLAAFTPTSLTFASQTINTTSLPQSTVLRNAGTGPLKLTSISVSGNFGVSHNCPLSPSTIAAGASCTINATFTPTVLGLRSGSITVVSDDSVSPQTVPLSGTGQATPACGGMITAGGVIISGGVQFNCGP